MITRARLIQGWNPLSEKDARPMIQAWYRELDRHHVPMTLYDQLMSMAIDHRIKEFNLMHTPPPLSIELVIGVFMRYKQHCLEKRQQLETWRTRVADIVNEAIAGVRTDEQARQSLLSSGYVPPDHSNSPLGEMAAAAMRTIERTLAFIEKEGRDGDT